MSKKKATSSDVAKRAGVSQATVSMVLNKKYNVSFSRETVEPLRRRPAISSSQRIRLSSSWTKEQKRKPEREADRCFLPYAYKPVLCIASAGD